MSSLVSLFIDHLLTCNELTMSQLQKFVTNACLLRLGSFAALDRSLTQPADLVYRP